MHFSSYAPERYSIFGLVHLALLPYSVVTSISSDPRVPAFPR